MTRAPLGPGDTDQSDKLHQMAICYKCAVRGWKCSIEWLALKPDLG